MAQMPLYNTLTLPGGRIWLRAVDYQALTGKAPAAGERITLLMQKEDQAREELTEKSFFPLAVAGVNVCRAFHLCSLPENLSEHQTIAAASCAAAIAGKMITLRPCP